MLLATINAGTAIIALPALERALHTSIPVLVWVTLAYMIASSVLMLTAGRLSDLFGRKRAYVGGMVWLALASLGAGLAHGGTELIVWRVVQGIGAAFLYANSTALVADAFPRRQLGMAMGTNAMIANIGQLLGPILGGAILALGWKWVFWLNVPLGLVGAAWAALVLRELATRDKVRGLDLWGSGVFIVALTGLILAISRGGISGWSDPFVVAGLITATVFFPLYLWIELRGRAPMLDLTIFRSRTFAGGSAAAFINGLSRFSLLFVFVFYFQGAMGDTGFIAGMKVIPLALGILIASPIAGVLADRHGSRVFAAVGMVIMAAGLVATTTLGLQSPYWHSALALAVIGIGSGMFNSPNTAAMMAAVPAHRRGIAAGVRTMLQNTGAVLSIALTLAILTTAVPRDTLLRVFSGLGGGLSDATLTPFIGNMHLVLWVLAVSSLVGAGISLLRPKFVPRQDSRGAPARIDRVPAQRAA